MKLTFTHLVVSMLLLAPKAGLCQIDITFPLPYKMLYRFYYIRGTQGWALEERAFIRSSCQQFSRTLVEGQPAQGKSIMTWHVNTVDNPGISV